MSRIERLRTAAAELRDDALATETEWELRLARLFDREVTLLGAGFRGDVDIQKVADAYLDGVR